MKIRIKKTGEVLEDVKYIDTALRTITILYLDDGILREMRIKNLSDIEEVVDNEETDIYWFINASGEISSIYEGDEDEEDTMASRQIGNYFKTKEEAEKAVEKLEVLKRLTDKGFRFFNNKIIGEYGNVSYKLNYPATSIEEKDLDLLFGGEE